MIIVIDSPPSSASVVAAFFDFGFLNAGTPLLIASTPVRAAHPDANARRIRKKPGQAREALVERGVRRQLEAPRSPPSPGCP